MEKVIKQLKQTKAVVHLLQQVPDKKINAVLRSFSKKLLSNTKQIIKANQADILALGPGYTKTDRLLLDERRLKQIAQSIHNISRLPNPTGKKLMQNILPNGLQIEKITVPLGIVAAIYESRPNVTADIASLCLKSRNACILKGSSDADHTNKAIIQLLHAALREEALPQQAILLLPPQREIIPTLFTATRLIDVIIPRGSDSLIQYVRHNSLVPVIETGAGVCHIYVHKDADIAMAVSIVLNAKTSRPTVCNAMDTIIADEEVAEVFLSALSVPFNEKKVEMLADNKAFQYLKGYPYLKKAKREDYDCEFLRLACAVKIVANETEAMKHIEDHGTRHSEAIITKNKKVAKQFLQTVDAATVYHNASTRFTDGEEFGLGAEIGISTQKLHARGPFALEKLVTEKWILRGKGQVR